MYHKVGDWTVHIVDGHAYLPAGMMRVPDWASTRFSSLVTVTIPDSVTAIGKGAFYGCTSLAAVTIPNSVTAIGDYAFDGCSSLAAVTIPDSVTAIGKGAFDDCSSLATVTIPDTVPDADINRLDLSPTTNVIRWTATDYRRAGGWRSLRRWARLAGWLASRLRAAHARAAERSYAPGGAGYQSAATNFAATVLALESSGDFPQ